ncbi:MAG: heme ABC transporter ATP-binding protein [Sporocytophaga sp.]|uniref:heme ABC transporter ATP-binding protein n=1 Tax=Sporocytophaga sp. TaxID=2231183 RepID=UPI001B0E8921|nr:heme ABC transporter ATP-binding protein [Sporocytophaga sp.]MBO9700713.1 heme ABC transporter ATP-binding protein [Sporocytophaga sp.]
MLKVHNVSYEAAGKKILQDVSLSLESGKLNLILGPNGAGKSTLVKIFSGFIKPTTGEVSIGNQALKTYVNNDLAKMRAVLSQQIELPFSLKVWDVVMMGRYPHFHSKATKRDFQVCEELMKFFELYELAERNYHTLSGGEKQRVQFVRVMSQIDLLSEDSSVKYLILDEPLTYLDIYYQWHFMTKLREILRPNLVIVGVVHDLNLAAQFADNLILMKNGKIVMQGPPDVAITSETLYDLYKVKVKVKHQDDAPTQLIFS